MKYIDAYKTINEICIGCNEEFPDEPCEPSECKIRERLMNIPAGDVVEVVRCEECKYHNNKTEFCKQWSIFGTVKSDRHDYCSYGEVSHE